MSMSLALCTMLVLLTLTFGSHALKLHSPLEGLESETSLQSWLLLLQTFNPSVSFQLPLLGRCLTEGKVACERGLLEHARHESDKHRLTMLASAVEAMESLGEETPEPDAQPSNSQRLNEDFAKVLHQASDDMQRHEQEWKSRAYARTYKKAAEAIEAYPEDITDPLQLLGVRNVGPSSIRKLEAYNSASTRALSSLSSSTSAMDELTRIYGIGPKKAKSLIEQGVKSLNDLQQRPDLLTPSMQVWLENLDDIEARFPTEELDDFHKIIAPIFSNGTPPGSSFEIVGSSQCDSESDIDMINVVITNAIDDEDTLPKFLEALLSEQILITVLHRGNKCLAIGRVPGGRARRIGFIYASPEEYAFCKMSRAGSVAFVKTQRQWALGRGFCLGEDGLYYVKDGKKESKVKGSFPCEETIFHFLGMQYREPKDRIDSRHFEGLPGENQEIPALQETAGPTSALSKQIEPVVSQVVKTPKTAVEEEKPNDAWDDYKSTVNSNQKLRNLLTDEVKRLRVQELKAKDLPNKVIDVEEKVASSPEVVDIYTDGSCLTNPGPGGWGVLFYFQGKRKEIMGGERSTTNNRMELTAAIQALKLVKGLKAVDSSSLIHINTDSKYVKDGMASWIRAWKDNNWVTKSGTAVKNSDLWKELDGLATNRNVKWHWVKAHAGHPDNERVDQIARLAAESAKQR